MAAKYWVGGTGLWSTAGRWSTQTGQASFVATRPSGTNATLTVTQVYSGTIKSGDALYDGAGTARGVINQQLTPLLGGETSGGVGRYSTTAASAAISTNNQCYTIVNASNTTVPASANTDEIIFDGNSGFNFTVTISGTSYAGGLYIGSVGTTPVNNVVTTALKGTMTLAGASTLNLYGDLKLPSTGLTWTRTGGITASGTASRIWSSNGVVIPEAITITASGTIYLASAFTCSSTITTNTNNSYFDLTNSGASTGVYLTCSSMLGNTGRYITSGTTGKLVFTGTGTLLNGSISFNGGSVSNPGRVLLSNTVDTALRYIVLPLGSNNNFSIEVPGGGAAVQCNITGQTYAAIAIPSLNSPDWYGSFTYAMAASYSSCYLTSPSFIAPNVTVYWTNTPLADSITYTGNNQFGQNSQYIWSVAKGVNFGANSTFNNTPIVAKNMSASNIDLGASGYITITGAATTSEFGGINLFGTYAGNKTIYLNAPYLAGNIYYQNNCYVGFSDSTKLDIVVNGNGNIVFGPPIIGKDSCCNAIYAPQTPLNSLDLTTNAYTGRLKGSLLLAGDLNIPSAVTLATYNGSYYENSCDITLVNTTPINVNVGPTVIGKINISGTSTVNLTAPLIGVGYALSVNSGTFNTNNYTLGSHSTFQNYTNLECNGGTVNLGSSSIYGSIKCPTDASKLNAGTSTLYMKGERYAPGTYLVGNTLPKVVVVCGTSGYPVNIYGSNGTITDFSITGEPNNYYEGVVFNSGITNLKSFTTNTSDSNLYKVYISAADISSIINNSSGVRFNPRNLRIYNSKVTPANQWYASNSTDSGSNTGWIFGNAPPIVVTYNNSQFFSFF